MSMISIEWLMNCNVNDQEFTFNGRGVGDLEAGVTELHLESSGFPAGFQPVSCVMICNSPVTMCSIGRIQAEHPIWSAGQDSISVFPARTGGIYSSSGEELLRLAVSSQISFDGETLRVSNKMRGFSQLPALKRNITPAVEHFTPTPQGALSSTRFQIEAADGQVLTGLTLIPYNWQGDALNESFVRRYDAIDVNWDGDRNVNTVVHSAVEEPALVV